MKRGDFSRQSFLGERSEEILARTRVAIVGLGGGGSHIAQQLAHIGVGEFRLIDPDSIEDSNLNRLVTATNRDVKSRRAKVQILRRYIKRLRPSAKVITARCEWAEAQHLIRDAHVVFGCVDSFRGRRNLEALCRRFLIPYIDIGMSVEQLPSGNFAVSGQMIMTRPGDPCLTCLGFLTDDRLAREEEDYGDAGHAPQVVWTNGTLASLAVGAFVQLVTPWRTPSNDRYVWLDLEGNRQTVAPNPIALRIAPGVCPHYDATPSIGEPNFTLPAEPQRGLEGLIRALVGGLGQLAGRLGKRLRPH
jgi:hypothetical protein